MGGRRRERGVSCPRQGLERSCQGGSPRGFSSLLEAPGRDLLLLLEAPLHAGAMVRSNNINNYNSSHRENLVFTVNPAAKQTHHFVSYSLTLFIILCFNRLPLGPRDAFLHLGLFPIPRCAPPELAQGAGLPCPQPPKLPRHAPHRLPRFLNETLAAPCRRERAMDALPCAVPPIRCPRGGCCWERRFWQPRPVRSGGERLAWPLCRERGSPRSGMAGWGFPGRLHGGGSFWFDVLLRDGFELDAFDEGRGVGFFSCQLTGIFSCTNMNLVTARNGK